MRHDSAGAAAPESSDHRLAAAAGALGVLAGAAALVVDRMWRFPPTDTTAPALQDFVNAQRTELLVAMLLNTFAVTMWLVFAAGVWSFLRRRAGESLEVACFGFGFMSVVTLLLAGFTAFFVLVYRAPVPRDPLLLYDLCFGLLAMSGAPTVVALAAFASVVRRTRVLPMSTAWLALLGAAAHVALFASLVVREGFWSLQGPVVIVIPATLFAWIAATSIALARAR